MAGAVALRRSLLTLNVKKLLRDSSSYAQHTSKVTPSATFSTAFERAEGGDAAAESRSNSPGPATPGTANNPARQGMCDARQEAPEVDEDRASGVTGFMAEKTREGAEKAKEMADRAGDTAKKTVDGAWKAAEETTQQIKEAVTVDDDEEKRGPSRNADFRDDRNIEDLRRRGGGYDKGE